MLEPKLLAAFTKLFTTSKYIRLTTINTEGFPETRAMSNLADPETFPEFRSNYPENRFVSYFSTNTASDKMRHIEKNNRASVYYDNEQTLEGLLFLGTVESVADMDLKRKFWHEVFLRYYPQGVTDPTNTLLQFTPQAYKYYNGRGEFFSGKL